MEYKADREDVKMDKVEKTNPPAEKDESSDNRLLAQAVDAYAFHQGDKSTVTDRTKAGDNQKAEDQPKPGEQAQKIDPPQSIEMTDPYTYHQKGDGTDPKANLSPDVQKELDAKIAAFKKEMADQNFTLSFDAKDGPFQAIQKQRDAALAKAKSGQELTDAEKALTKMDDKEVLAEARRMRDRDFETMKTKDGKPRHFYTTDDHPTRWTEAEMNKLVADQEKKLLGEAQDAQKKLDEAKAREAQEAQQKEADAKALEQQQAADKALDSKVPPLDLLEKAKAASGLDVDMAKFRENLKAGMKAELTAGTLKAEDLDKPPRVGNVLVASGAVTQDELNAALAEQQKIKDANNGKAPRLGDLLKAKLAPDRSEYFDKASKFYDELKALLSPPKN